MTQSRRSRYWYLGLAIFLGIGEALAFSGTSALAQIVRDATLGAESSVITSNVSINGIPSDKIDGGAIRGKNLFHSFQKFNIGEGRGAYFTNPAGIENILIRVTGGNPSNILGTLGVNGGSANLFLLNPNGIIFGPNASLKIDGSFVASTASSLNFADKTQFSATATQTPPLLTVSVPIGLQFGGTVGSIINQSQASLDGAINSNENPAGLQVQTGKTLALIGGDVMLEGGNITAEGGRIELGSVASNSLVSLNPTEKGWSLRYEGVPNFQNIKLNQRTVDGSSIKSYVDASGENGNIQVQGRRVMLTDGSQIFATALESQPGGNVTVTASESLELIGTSPQGTARSGLFATTIASGEAGNIKIHTGRLLIQDGAVISTESIENCMYGQCTQATGRGGGLTVIASESVELTGTSAKGLPSSLSANTVGSGAAGDLMLVTGNLIVRNGATVGVSSGETGAAGSLEVKADSIRLDNQGSLSAETTAGERGNITLHTQELQLRHNSNITTNAGSNANGGNITIDTDILVALEKSDITANAVMGQGGNIQITAQGLFRSPDSKINASSELGINGTVQLNTLVNNPNFGLVNLPVQPVNVTGLIAQGCPADVGPRVSKFVVTGRGGLPPTPREALASEPPLADLGTTVPGQENRASAATAATNLINSESAPIVEATGWVTNAKGEVMLVANPPTFTPNIPWMTPTSCHTQ